MLLSFTTYGESLSMYVEPSHTENFRLKRTEEREVAEELLVHG